MLYNATKRELLEGLIVAELISKPGQGPLARRHFPMGARGPASGVRSLGGQHKQPGRAQASAPVALDERVSEPEQVSTPGEADDTPSHVKGSEPPRSSPDAVGKKEPEEPH